MSKSRRVDVGFKACLHEHNRSHPIGRLAIEVTLSNGKDAQFVADMKAMGISVCEFDLGGLLQSLKYERSTDPVKKRINMWVNRSTVHKRWLHVEPEFKPAYDKFLYQQRRKRLYGRCLLYTSPSPRD